VAIGLLAVAVVYYLQKEGANNEVKEKLNAAYAELKHINELNPHPGYANSGGSTSKVDNILIGQRQIGEMRAFVGKARAAFVPVPPIPDTPRLSGQEFTAELLRTIDQMRRDARNAGVTLPATNYNFAFDSIVPKVTFTASSLHLLARQLGAIKVINDVLTSAKINGIEGLRRVKVCAEDDATRFPNDYTSQSVQSNEWAVLEPFDLTLRCFSAELAGVMAGLASSPHGIIVKTINIEAVPPAAGGAFGAGGEPQPAAPVAFIPQPMPPPGGGEPGGMDARMRRRYGQAGGMPPPQFAPPPVAFARGPAPANRLPPPVLYEQAVRVTLTLFFVQMDASKGDGPGGKGRRGGPGRRQE